MYHSGQYYSTKKKSAQKQAKTAAATEEAVKAASKKSDKIKVKDKDVGQGVQQSRKVQLIARATSDYQATTFTHHALLTSCCRLRLCGSKSLIGSSHQKISLFWLAAMLNKMSSW